MTIYVNVCVLPQGKKSRFFYQKKNNCEFALTFLFVVDVDRTGVDSQRL